MTKAKKPESAVKETKKIIEKLVKLLEVKAEVEVKSSEGVILVDLGSSETANLIGYHGETLNALQSLTNLMLWRKMDEWTSVVVDIDGYRDKRKDSLEKMAQNVAQKVKFSGQPQALPPMSAFERRLVHLVLSEDAQVETVSEGDSERRVVVRPKS